MDTGECVSAVRRRSCVKSQSHQRPVPTNFGTLNSQTKCYLSKKQACTGLKEGRQKVRRKTGLHCSPKTVVFLLFFVETQDYVPT